MFPTGSATMVSMSSSHPDRLAQAIVARRIALGMPSRTALDEVTPFSYRVLSDMETGRRENYTANTLLQLDIALQWYDGSAARVLAGGTPEPLEDRSARHAELYGPTAERAIQRHDVTSRLNTIEGPDLHEEGQEVLNRLRDATARLDVLNTELSDEVRALVVAQLDGQLEERLAEMLPYLGADLRRKTAQYWIDVLDAVLAIYEEMAGESRLEPLLADPQQNQREDSRPNAERNTKDEDQGTQSTSSDPTVDDEARADGAPMKGADIAWLDDRRAPDVDDMLDRVTEEARRQDEVEQELEKPLPYEPELHAARDLPGPSKGERLHRRMEEAGEESQDHDSEDPA